MNDPTDPIARLAGGAEQLPDLGQLGQKMQSLDNAYFDLQDPTGLMLLRIGPSLLMQILRSFGGGKIVSDALTPLVQLLQQTIGLVVMARREDGSYDGQAVDHAIEMYGQAIRADAIPDAALPEQTQNGTSSGRDGHVEEEGV